MRLLRLCGLRVFVRKRGDSLPTPSVARARRERAVLACDHMRTIKEIVAHVPRRGRGVKALPDPSLSEEGPYLSEEGGSDDGGGGSQAQEDGNQDDDEEEADE